MDPVGVDNFSSIRASASAGGEEAMTPVQLAESKFKKRVEAAAAALRSSAPADADADADADASSSTTAPAPAAANATTASASSPSTIPPQAAEGTINPFMSSPGILIPPEDSVLSTGIAPGTSQRRLFEQMVTLRTRLNERLAASNKFAKFLEGTLRTRDADMKHANERLVAAANESESLLKAVREAAAASANDAVPREQVKARLDVLTKRLEQLTTALAKDAKEVDSSCIKRVPVRWIGMASDIKIMGTFDNWTQGVAMSPEFIEGCSNIFIADLSLIPGTYEIKFVVDGVWQTAPDWATTGSGLDANNLLVVE